jgi:hypothetical protein
VTGFNLNGHVGEPSSDESGDRVPAVGDGCPGNSNQGSVTEVEILSSASSLELYARSKAPGTGTGPTLIYQDPAPSDAVIS